MCYNTILLTKVHAKSIERESKYNRKYETLKLSHVFLAYALSHPRAVVIIPMYTNIATIAVDRAKRSDYFARNAISQVFFQVFT